MTLNDQYKEVTGVYEITLIATGKDNINNWKIKF